MEVENKFSQELYQFQIYVVHVNLKVDYYNTFENLIMDDLKIYIFSSNKLVIKLISVLRNNRVPAYRVGE